MIALALILAQAATAAAAGPAPVEDRILVMAERLRAIEASVGQDQSGRWRCSLSGTSGSGSIDDALCRATTGCVREHRNDREAIEQCVERHRSGILADFRRAIRGRSE